jgi:two-component system phosphate regulon sensor histidine kinase PhoR
LPERPLLIRGSHEELAQVFANLIENAIKYGAEGKVVRIQLASDAAPRPGRVGVSVIDKGAGIAREHLPRLTERFYRVDNERSRARGGTGLGLAIAKHILNRHRGDLAISSTPGEGSCFTVWLPGMTTQDQSAGRAA